MRIKTITCHEVYNYGASLQEYALLKFLNKQGWQASVLHYKPQYLSGHFNLWSVSPKFNKPLLKQLYLLAKLPGRMKALKKKKAFDTFHNKYIPTDKKLYRNNQELKENIPEGDVFICGSDQIWNSFFENGKDSAFYLNFVPDDKMKISYAASFAIDELEEGVKQLVKKNVERMHAVSVRETSGLTILKDLGIDNAVQVLDPVFLLERSHWDKFIFPIEEDFIFIYDFDSNPLIKEIALELKTEKGWKIYSLNQNIDYADENFWLEGPERFLSLVSQSKMNLTNSFHSLAFSLIFQQQFVVVNRTEKINTRMRDLLQLVNLDNRLITSKMKYDALQAVDFSKVSGVQELHIHRSQDFLLKALQ